ncbi:Uncharacterised protein [Legionella beliardensis]|uniref:Uncharacterized protein n=1 Tax=Legionella beliardensis TaxID=91822 RepID=A0A378HZB8_9GAMM|nr:hypothetical protein [Legionella beliardensis]STX27790.1 Uncharacterised protein [Legionella beliardensis]
MPSEVKKFKARCMRILPTMENFTWQNEPLNDHHWQQLYDLFSEHQKKKLTSSRLIHLLSVVLDTDFDAVNSQLQRKNSDREVKQNQVEPTEKPLTRKKRRVEKEHDQEKENQDPQRKLITDTSSLTPAKKSKLEKHVRITTLTPSSPAKGYEGVPTMQTPKNTKVREVYRQKVVQGTSVSTVSLFKPCTPVKQEGRIKVSQKVKFKEVKEQLPGLMATKLKPQEFEVSLQDIHKAGGHKRRFGQNGLTGASCRKVFAAHEVDTIIKVKGSDYHWSHIRGLCIGGQHTAAHLMPATAASNYDTLNLIENFIIDKLTEKRAHSIDHIRVKVTPVYSSDSEAIIPEVIQFELDWEEIDNKQELTQQSELVFISPRSYQQLTTGARTAIHTLREMKISTEAASDSLSDELSENCTEESEEKTELSGSSLKM